MILFSLRWRRHFIVFNQRKGERPQLQRLAVLAIVRTCQKNASQCGRPARLNIEQPIELLAGLTC